MTKLKQWVDSALAHGYTTTTADLDVMFSSLPSFGKMLPYRDYHPEFGLFEMGEPGETGRYCGVMYEYASFVHDANSLPAQRYRISYEIEQALLDMPEGFAWQFMVDSDRNVSKYLPPVPPLAEQGSTDMMRELQREQLTFLHEAAKNGLWDKGHMYPKTMRFRCFIWRPPQKPTMGQRAIGRIEREPVQTESTDIKEQMRVFNQKVAQFEAQRIVRHIVADAEAANNGQLGVVGRRGVIAHVASFLHEIPEDVRPEVIKRLATDLGISSKEVRSELDAAGELEPEDRQGVSPSDEYLEYSETDEYGYPEMVQNMDMPDGGDVAPSMPEPIRDKAVKDYLESILDAMEAALANNQWLMVQDLAVDSFYNHPFPKGPWGASLRQFFKDVHNKSRRFDKVGVSNLLRMIRRGHKEHQQGED